MRPIEDFCCRNNGCLESGRRGGGNLYFRGWSGRDKRIRMVYCRSCKKSFSERAGTALSRSRLPDDKVVSLLDHIAEGCGTRATGRLVHVTPNTVTRYAALAGDQAKALHDDLVAFSPSHPGSPAG